MCFIFIFWQANQRLVAPATPAQEAVSSAPRYRSAISTALPIQKLSIDLSMTARRPGSLPVEAKFEAVYGY
jgi:hypothetical protein